MNQSGGIFYHYLALRNSLKLWGGYKLAIADFLKSFSWNDEEISYWIGPSAGYSIPSELSAKRLHLDYFCEPEFLAKTIFRLRHGKVKNWLTESSFDFSDPNTTAVSKLLMDAEAKQVSRLIFCNILGQIPLLNSKLGPEYWDKFYVELEQSNLPVISYHDYYTFKALPRLLDQLEQIKPPEGKLDENSLHAFLQKELSSGEIGLVDHGTSSLAKYSKQRIWWRKDKTTLHLIDCIYIEKK